MYKNVTLRLEEDLLKMAKHIAVDRNTSLSAWVAQLLRQAVIQEDRFSKARERALARLAEGMDLGGEPLSRGRVYER